MKKMKYIFIALLIPQTTQPIKTSVFLGATAVAGVALYLAHSAYASQSAQKITLHLDEQKNKETERKQEYLRATTIKEAELLINNTDYNNALTLIQEKGDLDNPSTFNEDALYTITIEITKNNPSLYCAPNMQKTISSMDMIKEKLKQYVPVATFDQSAKSGVAQEAQPAETIDTITPLIEALDIKINTLNKLYTFCRMHTAYISLVQKEIAGYKRYRSIIKFIDQEVIDTTCSKKITNLLAADYPNNTYPYIDAHKDLREVIKSLYTKLEATDKTVYPQQTQSAQTLLEKLEAIECIIITSNEIMSDRARRDDQRVVKEKQDLENAWKDKEFRLVEKQQTLEQEWQRKAEMMYEKGQRETQKIAREKQELEKELKEREFRLIEKQQRLEREWQQKSASESEQLTKDYRIVKAALEELRTRLYAVEKAQQPKPAQ